MVRPWMIYGANGFTGALLAELARERGHQPILAGRSRDKLEPLAHELGLESCVFALDDAEEVRGALDGVDAVVHCAGPFSSTSAPMVDGCIATKTHYLDVTGEIAVFEAAHARGDEAREAGIALICGVGFDVVPTDCLAALLAARMPDAVELELAFSAGGSPSQGTTKTAVEGLPRGGRVRRNGKLERVPALHRQKRVRFHDKPRDVVAIPWGDVCTAFYSTGIPNITVYTALPKTLVRAGQLLSTVGPLLALRPVQAGLKRAVELFVQGPNEDIRRRRRVQVWGRVGDRDGASLTGTLSTPEGYTFTADSALRSLERVLEGVEAGALTPSLAFGADFVSTCDGVELYPMESDGA